MTASPAACTAPHGDEVAPAWLWPINVERYDRAGPLSSTEQDALTRLGTDLRRRHDSSGDTLWWHAITRLLRPLDDARDALRQPDAGWHRRAADDAIAVILLRCAEVETTYWGWTSEEWLNLLGPTAERFKAAEPRWATGTVRPYVLALGYLLSGVDSLHRLGAFNRVELAYKIFGQEAVDHSVHQVVDTLAGWGYRIGPGRGYLVPSVLCQLLLHNRSPLLQDLSTEVFCEQRYDPDTPRLQARGLFAIQKAVASLGFCDPPVRTGHPGIAVIEGTSGQWARYVQRWYDTSTLTPKVRSLIRTQIAKAGRWLAVAYPDITEPGQWTRQTCAAWVAAVDRMNVGDYVQHQQALGTRVGAPISPATKAHILMASRTFFRDCQEWEWIPRRLDPTRALAAPRSVRALLRTNPRVIADEVWAKLLWAGLNLTPEDLPTNRRALAYPIEFIRAITLTWLFLRPAQRRDRPATGRLHPMAARRAADPRRLPRRSRPGRGLPAGRANPQDRLRVHQTGRSAAGQGNRSVAGAAPGPAGHCRPQDR